MFELPIRRLFAGCVHDASLGVTRVKRWISGSHSIVTSHFSIVDRKADGGDSMEVDGR